MKNTGMKILVVHVVLLLLANGVIWTAVLAHSRESILTVAFLDVGQGDAIFIEAPNGNQILIDGGPNASVLQGLGKQMLFYDRHIDTLIVTHPDKDHIGGAIDVMDRFQVGVLLEAGVESDTDLDDTLARLAREKEVRQILAKQGMMLDLGSGVFLEILFPDREVDGLDPNTASIIARLFYGETAFLFTGDSPKAIEEYISRVYGGSLRADVLKVGHHGSKTSTSNVFLSAVDPSYAVISAGKENRYGHPHSEVMDMLEDFDIVVLSTAEEGALVFESDGKKVTRQ